MQDMMPQLFIPIASKIEPIFLQVNQNSEALKKNFLELTELKHILRKTQQFFDEQEQVSDF